MKKVQVLYVYDPLCGWCFGFSNVINRLAHEYSNVMDFDVISGGMIVGEREGLLDAQMGSYILNTIPRLEEYTGVTFGELYKQQIVNGSLYQSSVKPSVALTVFKSYHSTKALQFSSALQYAQFVEGKSLEKDETYLPLIHAHDIDKETFLAKINSEEYRSTAHREFALAQTLGVKGFPALLAHYKEQYYQVSSGYQPYEKLKQVFDQLKSFD